MNALKLPRPGAIALSGALIAGTMGYGNVINISSRAVAERGNGAIIAGFVMEGDSQNQTLIRGAGPALSEVGVEGALAEVRLELFQGSTAISSNDGWDTADNALEIADATELLGAFAFTPGSKDAALLLPLSPGAYTAIVTPAHAGIEVGVALVEVYDADLENSVRLVNLSTRAGSGIENDLLIAGFVVEGQSNRIMARAIGPGLEEFGVVGVLEDPVIELLRGQALRARGDNWADHPDHFEIASRTNTMGGFPLDRESPDAAVLVRSGDGAFSAQVRGADAGTGVALVELYDVHALTPLPPAEAFDLVGFARLSAAGRDGVIGGGSPTEGYDPVSQTGNFWVIDDETVETPGFAEHFRQALFSDEPLIVELNAMIDLSVVGYPDTNDTRTALTHPDLVPPGQSVGYVGVIEMGSNKTIYSPTGTGGFRRGNIFLVGKENIMFRNLQFRELWEWDEATRGDYDRNGWDYLTLLSETEGDTITARTRHIWIDHCNFANAYDGQIDVVRGSDLVTISWCRFGGGYSDDAAAWVERQMDHLEANRSQFPYYDSLRSRYSREEVLEQARTHKKSSLVGNGSSQTHAAQDSGYLNVTYHHNWYHGTDQRMPRIRYGNAHVFNIWVDYTPSNETPGQTFAAIMATSEAAVKVEDSFFVDVRSPIRNWIFFERNGKITVQDSVNRDFSTNTDKGFDSHMLVDPSDFRWNHAAPDTGLSPWPYSDNSSLPDDYFPEGRSAADYYHPADYLSTNLHEPGVIVPQDKAAEASLRQWLQSPTPSAIQQ